MSLPEVLLLNATVIASAMSLLWVLSLRLRDASIVDIFWGLGFTLVAATTYMASDGGTRAILLTALTMVWGIRLSIYLAWRNVGHGEDSRYQAMRQHHGERFWWVSLLTVFALQGALMWVIALPVQAGQISVGTTNIGAIGVLGLICWLIGFLFESIGDYQLARFKSDPANRGKVLDRGLWRYTRHPNYFGNALIWWGIFLVSLNKSTAWTVVSPALMTFLLLKISGVALLERSLKSRTAGYEDYINRTSPFFPWLPRRSKVGD